MSNKAIEILNELFESNRFRQHPNFIGSEMVATLSLDDWGYIVDKIDQALAALAETEEENKRLKALCLRESGVLKEALKRKNNKSMIAVVADSLEEQALSGGQNET